MNRQTAQCRAGAIRQGEILGASGLWFLLAVAIFVLSGLGQAWGQVTISSGRNSAQHAGELVVPINKSQILRTQRPFTELMIGNPEIADVVPLTDKSIYLLGRSTGSTNLAIYGPNRQLIAVADLVVTFDVQGLKAKLYEVLPEEEIQVRVLNDKVLLQGEVSSPLAADRAVSIAETYAPERVENGLSVASSQQVMLQVRFAEVSRNAGKELGFSVEGFLNSDDIDFSFITDGSFGTAFGGAALGASLGASTIDLLLDALEERSLLRTLAEPNLIVLSGDSASFLAGGEFPIPVNQDEDSITIEFKEFGVSLAFTPTILSDGLINLVVRPEVSTIDPTNSILLATGGIDTDSRLLVPGLITRRAETTVELRDGQTFAIAGLFQNNYENSVSQFPWLGEIPVLGLLFSSRRFQDNQTELVILVTPRLVQPASSPDQLALPTDLYAKPKESELFLMGRTVKEDPSGGALSAGAGGGMSGQHGYILK